MSAEMKVGEFLSGILPRLRTAKSRDVPRWPPDVFGLMAALVQRAGLYGPLLTAWPPRPGYAETCRRRSLAWRLAIENDRAVPEAVQGLWASIVDLWDTPFSEIADSKKGHRAVLTLMAVADECGSGLGGVYSDSEYDEYEQQAAALLNAEENGSTLCSEIHPSRLRVLPKRRTPPSGLNVRSLSLHLACTFGCEVKPYWTPLQSLRPSMETLNILVIPYPFHIDPLTFRPAAPSSREMTNMDGSRFGFFTVERKPEPEMVANLLRAAIREGERQVRKIHLVLFPEASLSPDEYARAKEITDSEGAILMAGVGAHSIDGKSPGTNAVQISDPDYDGFTQAKHHRWRLNRSQIFQYELGATLNPAREWWEYIAIHDRKQHFLQVAGWLLIAPLICEDLARPDPVGDVVRAVGPDLVIAFLMDGPQLPERWPARYATVLADDPGCSVLTITSLGMALRSQPPAGVKKSRQIASWKDPVNGLRGIELPADGAGAVVLTLNQDTRRTTGERQVSADGRENRLTTGFPILSRVQCILLEEMIGEKEGTDDKGGRG